MYHFSFPTLCAKWVKKKAAWSACYEESDGNAFWNENKKNPAWRRLDDQDSTVTSLFLACVYVHVWLSTENWACHCHSLWRARTAKQSGTLARASCQSLFVWSENMTSWIFENTWFRIASMRKEEEEKNPPPVLLNEKHWTGRDRNRREKTVNQARKLHESITALVYRTTSWRE